MSKMLTYRRSDRSLALEIQTKIERLVWYAQKGIVPECECGKCQVRP